MPQRMQKTALAWIYGPEPELIQGDRTHGCPVSGCGKVSGGARIVMSPFVLTIPIGPCRQLGPASSSRFAVPALSSSCFGLQVRDPGEGSVVHMGQTALRLKSLAR